MALRDLSPVASEILLAGDAMHEYRFSNEVIELVREYQIRSILGNHEAIILGPTGERVRNATTVRRRNLQFVAELPSALRTVADGVRILMIHGNPWQPHNRYLDSQSEEFRRIGDLGTDVLITGHTHIPMIQRLHGTLVINPGSLGESREPDHRNTVTCALFDTSAETVELLRYSNPLFTASVDNAMVSTPERILHEMVSL